MTRPSTSGPVGLRPGKLDLEVVQHNDFAVRLEFVNADDDPIDITGWDLVANMRETYQGALIATFALDSAALPPNEVSLRLTAAQTALIGEGVYPWDLLRYSGGSLVRTLLRGVAVVVPVTQEVP